MNFWSTAIAWRHNKGLRVTTPIWSCNHPWQYVSVWGLNQAVSFFFFKQNTVIQKRAQGGALIILPSVSWLSTRLNSTPALCSLKWNLLRPQNRILRRRAAHYSTWDCVISSLIAGGRECSNPLIQSDLLNCLFGLDQTRYRNPFSQRIVRQLGSDWLPQPVRPWKK